MAQSWPWCSQIAVNIYIYDLDAAVAHSKVHHSAEDDTNMLYISNSLKDTNRKVNYMISDINRLMLNG